MDEKRLVQIGTRLDKEIYAKAKAQAAIEGRRVGDLIDDAIEAYLAERSHPVERQHTVERPHPVERPYPASSRILPTGRIR